MTQPLISVIVPVYKAEQYLHRCIDSILNQTHGNLEIILIDDGSPCKCPEICDEYAAKDERVVVIHQENSGPSVARNNALDIMRGEYVAFVDSDDWIEETAYEDMMDMMLNNKLDVVCCTANIIINDEIVEQRFEYFENHTILPPQRMVELSLTDEIGGQVWYKLWHRRCWEKVRFPIGRTYEDLAISFYPFIYAIQNVGFLKKALYNYRMNPEGISFSPDAKKAYNIFWAFKERYEYARAQCNHLEEKCLINALNTALGAYNRQVIALDSWDDGRAKEIKNWLYIYEKQIVECRKIKKLKKISIWLLMHWESIYRVAYSLYYPLSIRIRRRNE